MAQSLLDLERASASSAAALHHIHITDFSNISFSDFDHVDAMIEAGRNATERYLRNPQPRLPEPPRPVLPAPALGPRPISAPPAGR